MVNCSRKNQVLIAVIIILVIIYFLRKKSPFTNVFKKKKKIEDDSEELKAQVIKDKDKKKEIKGIDDDIINQLVDDISRFSTLMANTYANRGPPNQQAPQ